MQSPIPFVRFFPMFVELGNRCLFRLNLLMNQSHTFTVVKLAMFLSFVSHFGTIPTWYNAHVTD